MHGAEYIRTGWHTHCELIWHLCGILMCVHIFRPEVMLEVFLLSPSHFMRQGLSLKVELTALVKTGWPVRSQSPSQPQPQPWGYRYMLPCLTFMWVLMISIQVLRVCSKLHPLSPWFLIHTEVDMEMQI